MHDCFMLLLTVVMWDHGIGQLRVLLCKQNRAGEERGRGGEWRRGIAGFVKDKGSTEQGHLRSVHLELTSFCLYSMFIQSFHFSDSR